MNNNKRIEKLSPFMNMIYKSAEETTPSGSFLTFRRGDGADAAALGLRFLLFERIFHNRSASSCGKTP